MTTIAIQHILLSKQGLDESGIVLTIKIVPMMPLLLLPKVAEKLLKVEHCLQLQKEF